MSILKKLASQTLAYGASSILARLINFVFGFIIIKYVSTADYGVYAKFYAFAGFILVVLTHGMETSFFRHYNKEEDQKDSFNTAFFSIFLITIIYVLLSCIFNKQIANSNYINEPENPNFVFYFTFMLAFDVLAALPFASLRAENKPIKFAIIKIINIFIYIFFNIFFFIICPKFYQSDNIFLQKICSIYNPNLKVGYIFIANLIASFFTFILLIPQLKNIQLKLNIPLYKKMLWYALPIMVVGFAGMINEVLDRAIMTKLLPFDQITNNIQLGIYSFNYKFAMLMTLFLQAFRYAAEPLFFANANNKDGNQTYIQTMQIYTISASIIFLLITLNLPLIQQLFLWFTPNSKAYFEGAFIIPILLVANFFLGIYFNISTWYKITDKTYIGAIIAIIGATITLVLLHILVPKYGYAGAAWATLICYFCMVIIGYILEQKYYPINYDKKGILMYITITILLYIFGNYFYKNITQNLLLNTIISTLCILLLIGFAYYKERKIKQ